MPDILMTVCTYDEQRQADHDAGMLRAHGIRAGVEPCLYYDPENPGAKLVDLVVFDQDVARAQEILGLCPVDDGTLTDPAGFAAANRRAQRLLIGFGVLAALIAIVSAL